MLSALFIANVPRQGFHRTICNLEGNANKQTSAIVNEPMPTYYSTKFKRQQLSPTNIRQIPK
jgi:hypothetical protein